MDVGTLIAYLSEFDSDTDVYICTSGYETEDIYDVFKNSDGDIVVGSMGASNN